MLRLFERLKALRDFERHELPFLRTREDFDLIFAIGLHEAQGAPLTVKQIFLLGLGSVPTIQRRLAQLRRSGAIQQRRRASDRRSVEVVLAPRAQKAVAQYAELLDWRG